MEEYIRQLVFDGEMIKKYYLSPYVTVREFGSEIYIAREEHQEAAVLDNRAGDIPGELRRLAGGMTEEELTEFAQKAAGEAWEDWIAGCIQEGIIE